MTTPTQSSDAEEDFRSLQSDYNNAGHHIPDEWMKPYIEGRIDGYKLGRRHSEQELEAVKREYWEMGVTECVEELNKTESDATWILPNESRESTLALVKWLRDNLIRLKQSNQAQGGE